MKTKLIPFDINKAKAGAKVVTRCGYPARIGFYDVKNEFYPILALVQDGEYELPYSFTKNGRYHMKENESSYDLFIEEEEEKEKPRREYSGTDSIYVPQDDEGIREELIDAINGLWDNEALPMPLSIKRKDAWIAWLHKQGQKNTADEVEKEVKQRLMTKQELSKWLREHPEEFREYKQFGYISSEFTYYISEADISVNDDILIRRNYGKWEEPLIEEE